MPRSAFTTSSPHPPSSPTGRSRTRLFRALAALASAALLASTACQGDFHSRMAEIQALQDAGEWEASIEPLRGLLANSSAEPEVNFRLGVALMQTGRRSLAIWPLQKASQSDAYAVQAGILLTTSLLSTEDYDEAVRAADRVLEADAENTSALYARSQANMGAKRAEDALADAMRVLEILPEDPRATALRIAALIDLERFDDAEQAQIELRQITEASGDANTAARACGSLAIFYSSRDKDELAEPIFRECVEKYPGSLPVRAWAADFLASAGRAQEAAALWRDAIDETPENPELRNNLARLLENNGRAAEALKVLEESVELFDTFPAWRELASFHRRTGKLSEARSSLEKAIARAPGKAESLLYEVADLLVLDGEIDRAREIANDMTQPAYRNLLLGRIELAEGNPEAALEQFELGLRRWPNNARARYLAGLAALELGDKTRARGEFREATRAAEGETDAAIRLAELYFEQAEFQPAYQFAMRQIDLRPFTGPEAHVIAARAATATQLYELAEEILKDLLARGTHNAIAWSELANTARVAVNAQAAVAMIEKSKLDLTDPSNRAPLRALVSDLLTIDRASEALSRVDAAIAADNAAELHEVRGRVLAAMGRTNDAKAEFERAIAADAEYAPAYQALGSLAIEAGQADQALTFYQRAAKADPGSGDYRYQIGKVLLSQGKPEAALEHLHAAVELEPRHAGAANDLAWLLADSGNELDLALSLAQRASRLQPDANTLDTLGWVQLKRGDAEGAAATFQAAVKASNQPIVVRYHLGLALAASGKRAEAAIEIRGALETGNFAEADEARSKLARLEQPER